MRLDNTRGGRRFMVISSIVLIIFFSTSFFALAELLETREFSDTLTITTDGYVSHYYVERENTSLYGEIYIYHPENSLELYVNTSNLETLWIDCQGLYDDERGRVWFVPLPQYRDWIPSKEAFTVYLSTDGNLSEVGFNNADGLEPVAVTWNGNLLDIDGSTFMTGQAPAHGAGETVTVKVYYSHAAYADDIVDETADILLEFAIFLFTIGIIWLIIKWFMDQIEEGFDEKDEKGGF